MKRFPDWEARLGAYLESVRELAFEWSTHDCCTFSAGAVEAMTGVDAMAEFRGKYCDEEAAKKALRAIGKGTLAKTLDAKFEPVEPAFAHRGDLVLASGNLGISLGSFSMHVGELGDRQGLVRMPRASWSRGWRVPFTIR
jgi:hypothetical protein